MSGIASSLVSVIIPFYNAEAFLAETLDSLLNQSHSHWEAWLINDGSRDNSAQIAQEFAQKDARFRYHEQENAGVSAARNVGLGKMTGDFFCFLDADDVFPENSLADRLHIFQQDSAVEFVDGQVEVKDAQLKSVQSVWMPSFEGAPLADLVAITGRSFFGPTWMFRRLPNRTYAFVVGHTHGEDLLFYIQQAQYGGLYRYTKSTILNYRKGHGSAMSNLKGPEEG
ncbi:MAG TPA: glycosyl transferase family 2 [Cytophagales bacterium]|nr:glycosyl transferase family 2 [Cytophagales bacterium]